MGTAIFDGDKMVGEFNGHETSVMLIIRGEFQRSFWSMEDPLQKGLFVPIDMRQHKSPTIKVYLQGDRYSIDIKLHLEGDLNGVQSGINYENEDYMQILEKSIEDNITGIAERIIKIAQREYNSDVFKFGDYVRRTYWLQDDWEKSNWKGAFSSANIKVETDFHVRRPGMMYKSNPVINSKGEKKYGTE